MKKININLNGKKSYRCDNWECPDVKTCQERATDHHHLYPQTQYARRTYGSMLNEDFNIVLISNRCHLNKSIPIWSEKEFIEYEQAEGFRIKMPKSLQFKEF